MASPLANRLPRQLAQNAGRYIGIFALIAVSIAFVSGFLVAASSIERIFAEMPERYCMQDGQFTTAFQASEEAIDAVEDLGVTVTPELSREAQLELVEEGRSGEADPVAARLFRQRTEADLASYCEGAPPAEADEVSLDRVFCAHHDLEVGDEVEIGGKRFTLSGICTLPDYSALFEDPGDFMFDALTFCVGELTPCGFDSLDSPITYTYAYRADASGLTREEQSSLLEDIADTLADNGAMATSLMTADSNSAIRYAGEDVRHDQIMWEVMLVLIIAIMAFVFVIITGANIEAESAVIGTLLASGYRKRELIAHYMALPAFVGIAAAIVGNVIGYTVLYAPMRDLYYNSYSFPPYEAFWNWRVFTICTVVPLALLLLVNFIGLLRKLRCTPLEFLRHETTRRSRRRGIALPERLSFTSRFRLRILLCNLPSFLTLFCGITFASLLLVFGLCLMPVIQNHADNLASDLVAEHQYVLKAPVEIDVTDEEREAQAAAQALATTDPEALESMDGSDLARLYADASRVDADADVVWNTERNDRAFIDAAEKYAVATLEVERPADMGTEEVSVYGIMPASTYWEDVSLDEDGAVIGRGLAEKCRIATGDEVVLHDPISGEEHAWMVAATTGSASNMNVYLPIAAFNHAFGNEEGYFNGYASDAELALNDLYLLSDLTPTEMGKIVDQMTDSMGSITSMIVVLAAIVYVVLMYLLTKTVIDRSARSISYMKVFGYRSREVNSLYIRPITIAVIVSLLLCLPIIVAFLTWLVGIVFMQYNGNFEIVVPAMQLVWVVGVGIVCYAAIAAVHVGHIRKVPLEVALKVQE